MEKCRLIEVERFLEASLNYVKVAQSRMISRLKGSNNARAMSLFVFATPETTGVSRSSSNDLTYGTLPTGVDSPSLFRGARVCSTPISVTLARRTRIRLSFRGKLNGYRICGIRAFRPGGCFLRRSFRMENSVQGNHKHPPFPSSRIQ